MQYKTLKEISEDCGIQYHTIYRRLQNNVDVRTRRVGNVITVHSDDIDLLISDVGPTSPRTHGKTGSWIYSRWTSLLHYHREHVCETWKDFETFYADMGEPKDRNYKLTRINPELGWNANNCKWDL